MGLYLRGAIFRGFVCIRVRRLIFGLRYFCYGILLYFAVFMCPTHLFVFIVLSIRPGVTLFPLYYNSLYAFQDQGARNPFL